uniref:(northern house mosquito) hypothetical protein n=1 Tax=Culex pipiens TaxID=7175 RepID=A0A8D8HUA0_CULPI
MMASTLTCPTFDFGASRVPLPARCLFQHHRTSTSSQSFPTRYDVNSSRSRLIMTRRARKAFSTIIEVLSETSARSLDSTVSLVSVDSVFSRRLQFEQKVHHAR